MFILNKNYSLRKIIIPQISVADILNIIKMKHVSFEKNKQTNKQLNLLIYRFC